MKSKRKHSLAWVKVSFPPFNICNIVVLILSFVIVIIHTPGTFLHLKGFNEPHVNIQLVIASLYVLLTGKHTTDWGIIKKYINTKDFGHRIQTYDRY